MTWQDDFDAAHAAFLASQESGLAGLGVRVKAALAAAEELGEEALPLLDALAGALAMIPTPPTKAASALLVAGLLAIKALRDKFGGAA